MTLYQNALIGKELEHICTNEPDSSSSQHAEKFVQQTNLATGDAIANIAQTLYKLRNKSENPATYIPPQQNQSPLNQQSLNGEQCLKTVIKRPLKVLKARLKWLFVNRQKTEDVMLDSFSDDHFSEKDIEERLRKWEEVLAYNQSKQTSKSH